MGGRNLDFAIVRLQFTGQQLEQGRLAGPVAPDQGNALTRVQGKIDVFEQEGAADAVVDALQGEQRHVPL